MFIEIEYLSIIMLRFCYETFFKEIKRYNDVSPPETLVLLLYSISFGTKVRRFRDTFFPCVEETPTLVHNPLARDDLKFQHLIFVFVHQPTIMFCS